MTKKKLYEMRAQILKAMAHPSRLRMIDAMNERGEICVCDLVGIIGSDQSTVSKHLSILKQAGLVEDRKDGQRCFYHLVPHCTPDFFNYVEQVMREILKEQHNILSATTQQGSEK